MKKFMTGAAALLILLSTGCSAEHKAARQERKAVKAGNALYEQGRYAEACCPGGLTPGRRSESVKHSTWGVRRQR